MYSIDKKQIDENILISWSQETYIKYQKKGECRDLQIP